jgi:hypothetical protein
MPTLPLLASFTTNLCASLQDFDPIALETLRKATKLGSSLDPRVVIGE